jgi:hypothetical protein
VLSTIKWEGDLPVAGRLNLMGQWWRDLVQNPEATLARSTSLGTLRRLNLGAPNLVAEAALLQRLLFAPYLRTLREVRALPRHLLAEMAAAREPFSLERIWVRDQGGGGLEGQQQEQEDRQKLHAALARGKGLPSLIELDLPWSHGAEMPADYAWLWQSATGKGLKALRLPSYYFAKSLIAWHGELSHSKSAALALDVLELHWGQFAIRLHRGDTGWPRLSGDISKDKYGGARRELDEALPKLGQAIREVEIAGYPSTK